MLIASVRILVDAEGGKDDHKKKTVKMLHSLCICFMLINLFPNHTSVSIERTATISNTTSGGRSRAIERADQMQHQNHSKTSSHTTTRRGVRLSCSRMQLHSCKRETWLEDNEAKGRGRKGGGKRKIRDCIWHCEQLSALRTGRGMEMKGRNLTASGMAPLISALCCNWI